MLLSSRAFSHTLTVSEPSIGSYHVEVASVSIFVRRVGSELDLLEESQQSNSLVVIQAKLLSLYKYTPGSVTPYLVTPPHARGFQSNK